MLIYPLALCAAAVSVVVPAPRGSVGWRHPPTHMQLFPDDFSPADFQRAAKEAAADADAQARSAAVRSFLAEETAAAPLKEMEDALLYIARPSFDKSIAPVDQGRARNIATQALKLTEAAASSRGGEILRATDSRAGLMGDWRLIFTDSDTTLRGGLSGFAASPLCSSVAVLQRLGAGSANGFEKGNRGPGVGRIQCVEVLGLPLGVRNAVALKGSWKVDEDEEGSILISSYESVEGADVFVLVSSYMSHPHFCHMSNIEFKKAVVREG